MSTPHAPSAGDAWIADIEVDAGLAARLVAAQFAELATTDVTPLGAGWDNAAFLFAGHVVFRFPRRRQFAHLIEREISILPHIASHVPLPISAPSFRGAPSPAFPWPFAGYAYIAGATACSRTLSDASRTALAAPLATFLRALHDIEPAPLVAAGLAPDDIGRLDHEKRVRATRERLAALGAARDFDEGSVFLKYLETNPPEPRSTGGLCVVHGDLYARHIVLDEQDLPAGVIDWGDVHLGDPALDIAIAHLMLPSSAHGAFRAAYGPIDERTWNTARYRAIYHAILELDYGVRAQDRGMREIGYAALRLLRPSLA